MPDLSIVSSNLSFDQSQVGIYLLDMLGASPAPVSAAPIAIAKTAATRHRAPRATRRDLIGALELGRIRAAAHQVRIDR